MGFESRVIVQSLERYSLNSLISLVSLNSRSYPILRIMNSPNPSVYNTLVPPVSKYYGGVSRSVGDHGRTKEVGRFLKTREE